MQYYRGRNTVNNNCWKLKDAEEVLVGVQD